MEFTIENIGNLAIALSFVAALIFGIAHVKAAARDRRERLTLETLRSFQTREFAEVLHHVRILTPPRNQEEMDAMTDMEQIILIQASQMMESLGMLVHDKYIDLDLVDKTLGSYVTTVWEKFKPFFLEMREKIPDPYLGEYFQWLAERVDEKMKTEQRAPYY